MDNPLQAFLDEQGFVVLDGGLATELENRGADLDHFLWSARLLAEAPDLIREVHQDYFSAGADVVATATYQASFDGFARAGFERGKGEELMRLSVALAAEARECFWSMPENRAGRLRPLIAASIGPYGASLHDGSEYHGNYDIGRQALRDFHAERLDILADTPADLFAFETIPSQREAEVLVELMADYPGKVAWLSFSCRDEVSVSHGETFADCAGLADGSDQIVAVGINCTAPQHIAGLLDSVAGLRTPLVVYPNSGEHWVAGSNRWAGEGCSGFPVRDWYERGARLMGGCCRTGPGDIRVIRSGLLKIVG
jgi:homocysteine S-methyltransferase